MMSSYNMQHCLELLGYNEKSLQEEMQAMVKMLSKWETKMETVKDTKLLYERLEDIRDRHFALQEQRAEIIEQLESSIDLLGCYV